MICSTELLQHRLRETPYFKREMSTYTRAIYSVPSHEPGVSFFPIHAHPTIIFSTEFLGRQEGHLQRRPYAAVRLSGGFRFCSGILSGIARLDLEDDLETFKRTDDCSTCSTRESALREHGMRELSAEPRAC